MASFGSVRLSRDFAVVEMERNGDRDECMRLRWWREARSRPQTGSWKDGVLKRRQGRRRCAAASSSEEDALSRFMMMKGHSYKKIDGMATRSASDPSRFRQLQLESRHLSRPYVATSSYIAP